MNRDFYDRDSGLSDMEAFEEKRAKRRRSSGILGAAIVFSGGILIGICIMLIVMRLSGRSFGPGSYGDGGDAGAQKETEAVERELTQEDLEEIRAGTQAADPEEERLLADQDSAENEKLSAMEEELKQDEQELEKKEASGSGSNSTVNIDWDVKKPEEIYFSEDGSDVEPPDADRDREGEDTGEGKTAEKSSSGKTISEKTARGLLEGLKQALIEGEGTMNALRGVFVDQIMVTSQGSFYFFPISDELEHHGYEADSLLINSDGTLDYMKDDGTYAKKGVDVSKYQGAIDWEKVAGDGIEFAFIRAGFRGYGSGEMALDETFLANATAASAQGIEIGAYFFTQAVNEEEAEAEAQLVLDALGGNSIAYPIVLDVERVNGGRINNLSRERLTDICLAFCAKVREAGYEPMIYGNMETFMLMLELDRLEDISKWFAYYNNDLYYPYKYDIWQYSCKGRVNGINGEVDLNLSFR